MNNAIIYYNDFEEIGNVDRASYIVTQDGFVYGSDINSIERIAKNTKKEVIELDKDNNPFTIPLLYDRKELRHDTNIGFLIKKYIDADYEINDERQSGKHINVDFKGELRQEQDKALKELTKYDNGILHAATAFGKTVVSSAIIAQKKVNTLIILESSALIEQWKDALEKFLNIDEELPSYETKTGRVRKRKSLIGTLQGVHDSMTGIIDIAMAGSLCKKGEFHKLLNEYGLVLIDECHHSASETIANVLKELKAKYVYGVTATPKRADGLEKINYMLIGPIRYSYTAKEKAKEQGIQHLVYPRFTRTVPPRGVITGKMHPNEAYDIIHNNDLRDEQIVDEQRLGCQLTDHTEFPCILRIRTRKSVEQEDVLSFQVLNHFCLDRTERFPGGRHVDFAPVDQIVNPFRIHDELILRRSAGVCACLHCQGTGVCQNTFLPLQRLLGQNGRGEVAIYCSRFQAELIQSVSFHGCLLQ